MAEYHNQSKLRFWCQMVLPLVYDDSLSYMELLNKVVNYLNNCIQDVGNCETNIESLLEAFVNLQDYVNEIVEDLSPEIESVIDQMIADGDFTEIMADAMASVVADEYDPDKADGYLASDYVMHDGKLYACTSYTSGEWDSTKWRECTIGDELNNLENRAEVDISALTDSWLLTAKDGEYKVTGSNRTGTFIENADGNYGVLTVKTVYENNPYGYIIFHSTTGITFYRDFAKVNNAITWRTALQQIARESEISSLSTAINTLATLRAKMGAKNLLPFPYEEDTKVTHGITYTVNSDSSITINGTNTHSEMVHFNLSLGINWSGYRLHLIYSTPDSNISMHYNNSVQALSLDVAYQATINNVTVYPMVLDYDETVLNPFEKYAKTNVQLTEDIGNLSGAINDKENKREIIIFGDSFSDTEQTGGSDKWAYKLASRHPIIPVHNYAKGGSRIVGADSYGLNGTIGGQIATAIADTTFNHNNVTDIIIMAGVNDFRGLSAVNETTSSAVGNDVVNKISGRLAPEFPNAKYIVLINNSTPASHYQYMYGKSVVNAIRRNYGCRAFSMVGWVTPAYISSDHIHPTAAGHQQILANVEAILFGGCPKYITAVTSITATSSDNKNAIISFVEMFNEENVIIQCTFNITGQTTVITQFDCDMPSANFYTLGYFPAWFVAANLVNAGLLFSQNTIKTTYNPAPSLSTQNEITGGHVTLYASPYTTGAGLGFMISNNNW